MKERIFPQLDLKKRSFFMIEKMYDLFVSCFISIEMIIPWRALCFSLVVFIEKFGLLGPSIYLHSFLGRCISFDDITRNNYNHTLSFLDSP